MSSFALITFGILLAQPAAEAADGITPTKLTLDKVVKNVQKNEKLYDTFEMRVREEYKLVGWDGNEKIHAPKGEPTAISKTSVHVIMDGERFLQKKSTASMGANSKNWRNYEVMSSYDGKQTRTVVKDPVFVRIQEKRVPPDDLLHPNAFLYHNWNLPIPFSKFLTMPDTKATEMRWTVLGEENVNNLRCVKLHYESVSKAEGTTDFEAYFWLAIDRNYLPVKYEEIRPWLHPDLPDAIGWVNSLKEVESGIWVPERGESLHHDVKPLKEGQVIPNYRTEFRLEEAALSKKYDAEVFRPKIPEGAVIHK